MSRCAVRTGSVFTIALLAAALFSPPARAAARTCIFQGTRITLSQVIDQPAGPAISVDDPGLQSLLRMLGATVTYQGGQRYVLITTAEPVVISFAIGDTRYDVGPVTQTAPFAPFATNGHAFIPLDELLQALDLAGRQVGSVTILQPQLASIDVQSDGTGAKLIAHGGIQLDARIVSQSSDRLVILFDGVGSTLPASRSIEGGPVQRIDVRTQGTVSHPATYVTLYLAAGVSHSAIGTDDQRDVTIGFNGEIPAQPIANAPAPEATAVENAQAPDNSQAAAVPASSQLAQVTGVQTQAQNGNFSVRIAVSGAASYDWHRLRPPDNRWWIDVHGARLNAPSDQPGDSTVTNVRAHQENADTVRIALSLAGFQIVNVTPDANGVTVDVNGQVAADDAARTGSGTIGTNAVANAPESSAPSGWKFGPRPGRSTYGAANPRLIVIDPGHGGSDTGACWPAGCAGDGLIEKTLNLDMSKRLRDILIARGWDVVMTHEDDRDVYAANDTAQQELQARDDIANARGARLLVSLHSNSFINDGPHGATVYYYKESDLALAQAVDRRISSELGIFNDGVVKDKMYIVHHANMPATLVEAAFLSNPDDRALLGSAQWRQKFAQAIADGIADYAGPPPPASSTSSQ